MKINNERLEYFQKKRIEKITKLRKERIQYDFCIADVEWINTIFYKTPFVQNKGNLMNVYTYMGKHYIEKYRNLYMSSEEFEQLMEYMLIIPNKKGFYPLRVREEYKIE